MNPSTPVERIEEKRARLRDHASRIRAQLERMEVACPGTLTVRTKSCGKSTCRCSTDPKARHGPYFEWSRYEDGKLIHRVISREQARLVADGIEAWRKIGELMVVWHARTADLVAAMKRHK